MREIYVDHAATTKLKKEVLDTMMPYFSNFYANASSSYKIGVDNKMAIDEARKKVMEAIKADYPEEIIFTSGGSEADNMAIKGVARAMKKIGKHIITSKIEHSAVLNACKQLEEEGFEVTYVNVDEDGVIKFHELEGQIRNDTILISVMLVNNEIGTIEPVEQIGRIAKKNHIYFHVDAVQAIGSMTIDVNQMCIDLLSMSAHKFYGPKGIGALYVRRGTPIKPLIVGGHQEFSKRGGTENVASIVGMGKAIEIAYNNIETYSAKLSRLRDEFIYKTLGSIPECFLNGPINRRHPGNVNLLFRGINARVLSLVLSAQGIYCSSGAACNSASKYPSHVLKAIGRTDEEADSSIRISFGEENTIDDVEIITKKLQENVLKMRKKRSIILQLYYVFVTNY